MAAKTDPISHGAVAPVSGGPLVPCGTTPPLPLGAEGDDHRALNRKVSVDQLPSGEASSLCGQLVLTGVALPGSGLHQARFPKWRIAFATFAQKLASRGQSLRPAARHGEA